MVGMRLSGYLRSKQPGFEGTEMAAVFRLGGRQMPAKIETQQAVQLTVIVNRALGL